MSRRVVVTGLGLVTPLGTGVEKSWTALCQGRSGVVRITKFDPAGHDSQIAGEVKDFDPEEWMEKKEVRRTDPFCQYALGAVRMAATQAGIASGVPDPERVGVVIGSGIGGLHVLENAHKILLEKGPNRISPFFIPAMITNGVPGLVTIKYGFEGPNWATVSACATSAHAVGEAFKIIQRGDADAMVCGGAEATITSLTVAGFTSMKAMSTRNDAPAEASRPFDKDRDGFVIAEGAGILVIEAEERARARGAAILCELAGYGANSDAHHITQPSPEGAGAAKCMSLALRDAQLSPQDVGYINAHGTSTPYNDANETMAVKTVFGLHARKLAISSSKSMTGHMLGAAGGAEAVFSVLSLARGVLPPTINYKTPDPDCDLDYVPNNAREAKVDAVLSNSFGFGGTNAVLAFRRYRD